MTYYGAKARIERTENGWIVGGTDGGGGTSRWVFSDTGGNEGVVASLREALWQIVECLDASGSRFDGERIDITTRRGDKGQPDLKSEEGK